MKGIYFNTLKELIHDYFDHKTYLDILENWVLVKISSVVIVPI